MMTYDVKCPVCGRINRNLYLEETDGWMECEKCSCTAQLMVIPMDEDIMKIKKSMWRGIYPVAG